jgi:sugar transferase (PEP-CTERM/EpsH1 system associated)
MSKPVAPLVVNIIYALGTGGMENGLVNIINRTPPQRYRHAIICLTQAYDFARRITVPGVEVYELHKADGQDWSVYRRLYRLLRKLDPQIVHTRNLAALDSQLPAFFLRSAKQVHGEHGRDIYDLDGTNWKYLQLRKAMRLFIDHYIAVSRDLEGWLLNSAGIASSRLTQIYNGVDSDKFAPLGIGRPDSLLPERYDPGANKRCVIGTVGRLVAVKDQQLIIQAVVLLLERNPEWQSILRVILVGDGPLHEELTQQIHAAGLDDIVWMTGDRDDIPELLQEIDIFVLPSLGEGISNTILEAMSAGLPIVASDVGGTPELVEDGVNGTLFAVGDKGAFADALAPLIDSSEQRKKLGENAQRRVMERFDWSRTVASYLKVYDDLMGGTTAMHAAVESSVRQK